VFFYRPMEFLHNPLEIFMVWHGGMSFHGGFLGVLFAMWLWARKPRPQAADVYDFIAPLVPLGYAAGRLGNFINAELPGRVADPSCRGR
jgi:phosphatidylglycerol:prolipoprotein diacylglycerol transferase